MMFEQFNVNIPPKSLFKGLLEAQSLLGAVGLAEKLDAPARTLSGGMKRKLSLAIAFVGSPADVGLGRSDVEHFAEFHQLLEAFITLQYREKKDATLVRPFKTRPEHSKCAESRST